jgi:hypothetical protein
MNNKKEGEYYSQMVRRYKNEYGGKNLQEFCIKEKVSYTKMLHCLRNESYRKPQHQSDVQFENPGLMPLVVDSPLQDNRSVKVESKGKPYKRKHRQEVTRADFCLNSGIRLSLHGCDVSTLVSMIKEMEGTLC